MKNGKVTVAIIGCGARGKDAYASLINKMSDEMEIVAAVDTNEKQLYEMQTEYGVAKENCYTDTEIFFAKGRLADVAFICTMDRQHHAHAIAALKTGYHILLEKPISTDVTECLDIEETAKKYNRFVVVCHVLRYTPFFRKMKEVLSSGVIGETVSVQAIEMVGYWHQAHSFVRGNWRRSDTSSPMILQKCCHDFDIILWLCNKKCKRVSSFGELKLFKEENAHEGAPKFCLDGCPHSETCPYCAPRYYLTQLNGGNTGWPINVLNPHPTEENINEALRTGPYGRCVYHCDNNVVDHQVVIMELEGGTTVDFTMCAFTKDSYRKLRFMGTTGEVEGDMERNIIIVKPFVGKTETIDVSELSDDFSGHGGGEVIMLKELFAMVRNENINTDGVSLIEQSTESHYVALAAEKSRVNHGAAVDLEEFKRSNKKSTF